MRVTVLNFLVFTALLAQDQTGSIKGTIVDSVTHLPVSKAQASIIGLQRPQATGAARTGETPRSVNTDASGTFAIDRLEPGQYELTIRHRSYPQASFFNIRKSVAVKAGEESPVTIELAPRAAISGHIYDEDGDPMDGCSVQIHPAAHPEQVGMQAFGRFQSPEGQYRIFGIAAGRYIVTAQCQTPVFQPRPLSAGPDPPPSSAYPMQFYPGASSAQSAEVIDLAAGAERAGIDFRMKPAAVTHINVTLAPGDWRGRTDLGWQLIPAKQTGAINGAHLTDTSKGTFQIDNVFPGSYTLLITNVQAVLRGAGTTLGAVQKIDVSDKPAAAIVQLRHGVDINGTVAIENQGNPDLQLSQITILAMPAYPMAMGGFPQATVKNDGTFTLRSVFPGPLRLRVNASHAYLKAAWLGATEITGGKLDLSSGAEGDLKIVVSTNTATVQGTAPPGAQVAISSADEVMRTTQADPGGQFKMEGLPPGKYRIGVDQSGSLSEDSGQEVTLQEGQVLVTAVKAEERPR